MAQSSPSFQTAEGRSGIQGQWRVSRSMDSGSRSAPRNERRKSIRPTSHALKLRPMTWSVAIRLFAALLVRFGDSTFLAARRVITRGEALSLRRVLLRLETLLRHLLMRAASSLPELKARPVRRASKRAIPAPAGRAGFANEDPAAWGVSFPLGIRRSSVTSRRTHRRRRLPPIFVSAAPLAERLEAIARVFADPEPYVRRMARLSRHPHRRSNALRRSPDALQARSGVQKPQKSRPSIPGPRVSAPPRPGSG